MRKIFLTGSIVFASLGFVFGQGFVGPPCVINSAQDTINFIYPASDSFPCIDSGIPFYDVIQLSMPSTLAGVIVLDSLVITSITGLPGGMAYSLSPPSGVLYADSNGCVAFAGTTTSSTRVYPITFNGYAVVNSQVTGTHTYSLAQLSEIQGAPVPSYQLNVIGPSDTCNPQAFTAIQSVNSTPLINIYPNPCSGVFELEGEDLKNVNAEIQVMDITGRIVYSQLNKTAIDKITIDLSSFPRGLYILELRTSYGITSKKISIE